MEKINFTVKDVKGANFGINDVAVKKIYPPLVDETVIPTKEQQVLTHEGEYGYDTVTVEPIPDEYIIPEGTLPITENTTYDVTRFKRVSANVRPAPELQDKEATPTKETQNITFDTGFDGLNTVTIKPIPDNYIEPAGTKEIKTEGTHDVTEYASVDVDVEPTLQDKQVTITENGTQNITADEGFDGLGNVEITTNAIEDLDEELNEYNDGLTTQEVTINDIARALQNKILGGDGEELNATEEFYEAYKKLYEKFDPSYNKHYDTTEPVTLYTPMDAYSIYFIILRNNSKYQVMWTQDTSPVGVMRKYSTVSNSRIFWPVKTASISSSLYIYNNGKQAMATSPNSMLSYGTTNTGINYYLSPQYDTIEECVYAMKQQDTVYTKGTSQNNYVGYHTDRSCVVSTNGIDLGEGNRINENVRQISSNENIVVIGTEV